MAKQYIVLEVAAIPTGVHQFLRYVRTPDDYAFTIEKVDVSAGALVAGTDAVFNVRSGPDLETLATIFAMPADRPKIVVGAREGETAALAAVVPGGSYIVMDADAIPLAGLAAPVFMTITVEDGTAVKGDPGLVWRGAWNSGTAYAVDDAVTFGGSSWRAKVAHTNTTPVVGATWDLLAAKGDTGAAGASGADATVTRADVVVTTASVADAAEVTGTAALGRSFFLLRIAADKPCRVRIYSTAAARAADAARLIGQDPSGEHGIIADFNLVTGNLAFDCAPVPVGANLEGSLSANIPYAIQNKSGSTATVQVTFTRATIETGA